MNPSPTPNEAVRITAESQPQFPCWLHHPNTTYSKWSYWAMHDDAIGDGFTHWHPDQETAPPFAPEEDNYEAVKKEVGLNQSSPVPDWAMAHASDVVIAHEAVYGQIPESSVLRCAIADKIARHAPSVPAVGGVREAVEAALPRDSANKHIVSWPRDYAETVDRILAALAPYLAPAQRVSPDEDSDKARALRILELGLPLDESVPGVTAPHPTGKQAEGVDLERDALAAVSTWLSSPSGGGYTLSDIKAIVEGALSK